MQVYIKGINQTITVDDYLAFSPRTGQLLFSNISADGCMWGSLIEKTWASMNGNYEYIFGGEQSEAFMAMLGAPADYFDMINDVGYVSPTDPNFKSVVDLAWNIVDDGDLNLYPMGASIGSSNPFGLTNNHAYTIVGAYLLFDNNVQTNRLIKIRNPWGIDVYTGKWSDLDTTSWTIAN
jgi:calpain-15